MEKRTKILFGILVGLLFLSTAAVYMRTVMTQDFEVIQSEESTESE